MGIPKFFKWLTRRYPMILQNVQTAEECPPSDNLYLDLNSIVHNSIHGNDAQRHERISRLDDLEEVWADIMRAIDEIVHMVKPRKLILLAVDGVAPRAKMNQQRARRFRSAKDAQQLKDQLLAQGKEVAELFDNNQISPGTAFMHELGKQLEWFVKFKLNTDPLYQNCERIVLSDSSIPGEGEHKMMDYIRNLKLLPDYDPNTRHCFYGSDADLIMLSLLTHEPHFMIIREEHVIRKVKQGGVQRIDISRTNNLQLIHISLLREYFLLEYKPLASSMSMTFDLERVIDDFIFFCFFIGNDFLPSLSALDIGEGSLDHLINFYKKLLPEMTGYITDQGQIYWDRAEPFIALLGKHEHQVFINRVSTLDQKYKDSKTFVTFDETFSNQVGKLSQQDKTKIIQRSVQDKVKQKKTKKCSGLFMKNQQKKYKKYLLLKKFKEDYEESSKAPVEEDVEYKGATSKFKRLQQMQREKDNKLIQQQEGQKVSLFSIISEVREEYFSDLNAEEIPNSEISDVSESELTSAGQDLIQAIEMDQNLDKKIEITQQQTDKYIEKNHKFMSEFVNTYKEDSNEAKRSYYIQKLDFDVKEVKGKKALHKLLFRYLEGMQWVLYYYYKGAQHWRWYYPYHYAPMISDLGTNIVQDFLDGQQTITEFKTDEHCNENPRPYTPFQQLLCIFPIKSIKLFMPPQYAELAQGALRNFFPDDFDIDLNGRTLPWEAAILIPFADEELFISSEQQLFDQGMQLKKEEWQRNTTSFTYPSYFFDANLAKNRDRQTARVLKSTLRHMENYKHDFTQMTFHDDYEKCGQFGFTSKLLPGVKYPQPDYPSLNWLDVTELHSTEKYINKVAFKQCLAKIPQCKEDLSGADFEDWIYKFADKNVAELFIKFPLQIEACPLSFEDPFSVYQIHIDDNLGNMHVSKLRQDRNADQFRIHCNQVHSKLQEQGIYLPEFNTLVTLNVVIGTEYDEVGNELYKVYSEQAITIPFNLCMRKRAADHYLNVNHRTSTGHGRVVVGQDALCFNSGLFGVIGKIRSRDPKKMTVKIEIDQETEESKIHNPFLGENFLRKELVESGLLDEIKAAESQRKGKKGQERKQEKQVIQADQDGNTKKSSRTKRFYGDQEIERMLKLDRGIVNKLTGSFLIAFDSPDKDERQVVDIGLNIKNFTKKAHIPDYVRFISHEGASGTIYDDFQHNQHARGAKHIRKHWEYSEECLEIIKEYLAKYPEAIDAIADDNNSHKNKSMHSLYDLYPDIQKQEKDVAIAQLTTMLRWIEALPISKLPYVEMGFDALDAELIQKLQAHHKHVESNFGTIDLKVQAVEVMKMHNIYQESFPYWSGPYLEANTVNDFRVGNRVMNLNSVLRQYVPFGVRGTVVGKTEAKLIVLFDEQFLHGNDVFGHCEMYRGAQVEPNYLMNLSRSFARMIKENYQAAKRFQEKPLEGCAPFAKDQVEAAPGDQDLDDGLTRRERYLQSKFYGPDSQPRPVQSQGKGAKQGRQQHQKKEEKEEGKKPEKKVEHLKKEKVVKEQPQHQKKAEKAEKKPQLVYQPKAPAQTQPDAAVSPEVTSAAAAPSKEPTRGMFGAPLPGLKVLDPNLMAQPKFQKIIQMQQDANDNADETK